MDLQQKYDEHLVANFFKHIFLNENQLIKIDYALNSVPMGQNDNDSLVPVNGLVLEFTSYWGMISNRIVGIFL